MPNRTETQRLICSIIPNLIFVSFVQIEKQTKRNVNLEKRKNKILFDCV